MEEMQLGEMMHVDIKIGIDMLSLLVTDAGGGSPVPWLVHKFLFANQ